MGLKINLKFIESNIFRAVMGTKIIASLFKSIAMPRNGSMLTMKILLEYSLSTEIDGEKPESVTTRSICFAQLNFKVNRIYLR